MNGVENCMMHISFSKIGNEEQTKGMGKGGARHTELEMLGEQFTEMPTGGHLKPWAWNSEKRSQHKQRFGN